MWRPILATVLYLGLVTPALAAGQFDGEWTGKNVADSEHQVECGFEESPFRVRVENDRFIATGKDVSGVEKTFEGNLCLLQNVR